MKGRLETTASLAFLIAGYACGVKPEPSPPGARGDGDATTCWSQIQPIMQSYCTACHSAGTGNRNGAPASVNLDTYQDVVAHADRSAARMQAGTMPPSGPIPSNELDRFLTWVGEGTPQECTTQNGGDPGGSTSPCSTGSYSASGDENEGPLMLPGHNCLSCHGGAGEAPGFSVAGTVMGAFHDVDTCNGVGGVTVTVVDSASQTVVMTSNGAGNFFRFSSQGALSGSYTATLSHQGRTRTMSSSQTPKGCNACHTTNGANGAPGRIVAP